MVQEWSPSEKWRSCLSLRQFWGDARLKEHLVDRMAAVNSSPSSPDHVHPAAAAKAPTVIYLTYQGGGIIATVRLHKPLVLLTYLCPHSSRGFTMDIT